MAGMSPRDLELIDRWIAGEPSGVLALISRLRDGPLTPHQRQVLTSYLDALGIAIEAPGDVSLAAD